MRRWDPFYSECKKILENGELGRIETIVAYVDTALYMNSSHMLDMVVYFGGDLFSCVGHIDKINETRIIHGEKDFGGIISHLKNLVVEDMFVAVARYVVEQNLRAEAGDAFLPNLGELYSMLKVYKVASQFII